MQDFVRDLRRAILMSWSTPRITLVVVLTLASGIGSATAIFSFVDAVFFLNVPGIDGKDSVVSVWRTSAGQGYDTFSYPNYQDIQQQSNSFSDLAAYRSVFVSFSKNGYSRRIEGALVTGNYFETLGVHLFRGRGLSGSDDASGAPPVAVLSYSLWRELGGPAVSPGSYVLINSRPLTVVGVAAPDFRGTDFSHKIDVWLPISLQPLAMPEFTPASSTSQSRDNPMFLNRRMSWLFLLARLKHGVDFDHAAAETKLLMQNLRVRFPQENEQAGAILSKGVGLDPESRKAWLQFCGFLMGAAALLLLLSCANLGNFVLSRAISRRREAALCLALGAPRSRIIREGLVQSIVLAAIGGAAGFLLSFAMQTGAIAVLPESRQLSLHATSSFHLFLFSLALVFGTGTLFGLLPAWKLSRTDLGTVLKTGSQQGGSKSIVAQQLLVVLQVALSLVLLTGAGLLARTLRQYMQVDLGFDPGQLVLFSVNPGMQLYGEQQSYRFEQQLFRRLHSLPGLQAATLCRVPPLSPTGFGTDLQIPGKPKSGIQYNVVAPNYFSMMGISVRSGRYFADGDSGDIGRVIIVNETAAGKLWPGENPIGKRVFLGQEITPREVIGVVRDSKYRLITERPRPLVYLPMWQPHPFPTAQITIEIRANMAVSGLVHSLEGAVHEIDPNLPVFDIRTAEEQINSSIWQQRMAAVIVSSFAALALVLGLVGVYSIMAYSVRERTHEIGIRMALGARRDSVLSLILWQAVKLCAAGIALGAICVLILAPSLGTYMYGIRPRDPLTLATVAFSLLFTAVAASCFPAYWATTIEPTVALRYE